MQLVLQVSEAPGLDPDNMPTEHMSEQQAEHLSEQQAAHDAQPEGRSGAMHAVAHRLVDAAVSHALTTETAACARGSVAHSTSPSIAPSSPSIGISGGTLYCTPPPASPHVPSSDWDGVKPSEPGSVCGPAAFVTPSESMEELLAR